MAANWQILETAIIQLREDCGEFETICCTKNVNYQLIVEEAFEKKYDNCRSAKFSTKRVQVDFEAYKIYNQALLEKLVNGTSINTTNALVSGATQTVARCCYEVGEEVLIENQNCDGSTVVVNGIDAVDADGNVTPLLAADYTVTDVTRTINSKTGEQLTETVVNIVAGTLTAGDESTFELVIDYDYTPCESCDFEFTTGFQQDAVFDLRIIATQADNDHKAITIEDVVFNGTISYLFTDLEENGDIQGAEVTMTSLDGAKVTMKNLECDFTACDTAETC